MLDSSEFAGTERYQVRACLGRGAMGTVYQAVDRDSGADVAIKVLDSQQPEGLVRFKQEFRAIQSLRHRNLVRLGELGEEQGQWFYTMELIDGVDLLSAVTERDPHRFDEARLRRLLPQLAGGLAELHDAGKVHRDIKPSNILVTEDDRLVLLDFGLVYDADRGERVTGSGVVVGTGAYMAPEQARGDDVTPGPAADWYAVGTILYEVLTGELPYRGNLLEVLLHKQSQPAPRPARIAADVPEDLDTLCAALLDPEPARRPTGDQVLAALGVAHAVPPEPDAPIAGELFVGRDAELAAVVDAARTLTGPHTLLLEGRSGVGKTAIAARAIARLHDDSSATVVLSGRCYQRESVPFKGFDGVLDTLTRWLRNLTDDEVERLLPDSVAYLPQVFPSLRAVPAIAEIPPVDAFRLGQRELRARTFDALAELVTRLAETQPVVLHIDDMQWATDDTWAILEAVVRSPHRPHVLIVLTRRPPGEDADPARVLAPVERILIGALPPEQASELARRCLIAGGGDPGLADTIARDAAGHPMFIRQLARNLARGGDSGAQSLDDMIRREAAALPPEALRTLEAVCVAGVPLSLRTVGLAAGVPVAALLADVVPALADAHLIRTEGARASDRAEHFHDRVREAVLAGLDDDTLVLHHRRIAHALEQSGDAAANPMLAVHHLLAAGRRRHAAHRAIESARRAAERLAFDRSAELLRLALSLEVVDAERRRELENDLAAALVNAGRGPEAADIYLALAATSSDGFERLERKRQAAEQLLFSGHIERGMSTLEDVLAEVGERLPQSKGAALWALFRERARLRMRGLRWRARDRGDITPRELEMLELYSAIAIGLSLVDHIRATSYMARHLRTALRVGDRDQMVRALAVEGVFCAAQHKVRRARDVARRCTELAADATDPHTHAYACFARAAPAFFVDNDWQRTDELMVEAEGHVRDGAKSTGWESDTIQSYLCFTRMYLGELRGLGDRVDRWVGEARRRGSQYGVTSLRSRVVLPRLAADQPERARGELAEAMGAWLDWRERFLVQHFYALHSACEIALYQGDPEPALAACREQERAFEQSLLLRMPIVRDEIVFARARLLLARAASADGSRRAGLIALARRRGERLTRSPLPAPHGWAQLVEATALWLDGDRDRGIDALRDAVSVLEERACFAYARAAELALGRAIGGTEGGERIAAALAWAEFHQITSPDRFAGVFVPGWIAP